MLANFFGKSKPVNFIVIFTLFLGYFFLASFTKGVSLETVKELFWFIVVFSIFNFIITKNQLTYDNSYAFLFYTLLIGFFTEVIQLNSLFYANVTVLLFLRKVYSLQSSKKIIHKLFDGGLWLGISFLIEPYTAIFGFLLYVSIYLHQRFTYQTLLTPVLGFLGPILLYFTYHFWYDSVNNFNQLFLWYSNYNFDFYFENNHIFTLTLTGIGTVLALLIKSPKALSVKNLFRKNWILILIHLFSAGFIVVLIDNKQMSELLFLFFPTAIVLTNGIELITKKWLVDIVLSLFLILSFIFIFV